MKNTDKAAHYGYLALMFRQRLLPRWNRMRLVESENVLEHTAEVTLTALILALIAMEEFERDLDLGTMLAYAIIHDGEETLTTDLPSPIKKSSPEFYKLWKEMERESEEMLFSKLPDSIRQQMIAICHHKQYEHELVKCADVYVAYLKANREIAMGNHLEFNKAVIKCETVFNEYAEKYPELAKLHEYFGSSMNFSLDELIDN